MRSTNKPKSQKRRRTNRKNDEVREYVAPLLRTIKKPFTDVSITFSYQMQAGVVGTNGYIQTVTWANFAQLLQFLEIYQYFEIRGHQIEATLTPSIATFYEGAVAYFPINAVIGEVASTSVPTGVNQIQNLPGAVFLAPGARNTGRWFKPTSKQVYPVRRAYAALNAGVIVFYCDNVGAIERVGDVLIRINLRLYGEQYTIAD